MKGQIQTVAALVAVTTFGVISCGSDNTPNNLPSQQVDAGPDSAENSGPQWLDIEVVVRDDTMTYRTFERSSFDENDLQRVPATSTDCVKINESSDDSPPERRDPEYGELALEHGEQAVELSGEYTELYQSWTASVSGGADFPASSVTVDTPPVSPVSLSIVDGVAVVRNDGDQPIIPRWGQEGDFGGSQFECPAVAPGESASFDTVFTGFSLAAFTASRDTFDFDDGVGTFTVLRELDVLVEGRQKDRWMHLELLDTLDDGGTTASVVAALNAGAAIDDAPRFDALMQCVQIGGLEEPQALPTGLDIGEVTLAFGPNNPLATLEYRDSAYSLAQFELSNSDPVGVFATGTFNVAGFPFRTLLQPYLDFPGVELVVSVGASEVVVSGFQSCDGTCPFEFVFVIEGTEATETYRCPGDGNSSTLDRGIAGDETLSVYLEHTASGAIETFDDVQTTYRWRRRVAVPVDQ